MYDVIQRTVFPPVEFIQGIPSDLECDSFFDTGIRNLVVLDDLMSSAGKTQSITDMYTEGSHHRNLSIIALNQGLYSNKDATQRRNCHYLALFENPIDQQEVMTLARQMYPGKADVFMNQFDYATKDAYGYLLVDLKPHTPRECRLRPNGFKCLSNQHVVAEKVYKEEFAQYTDSLALNAYRERTPEDGSRSYYYQETMQISPPYIPPGIPVSDRSISYKRPLTGSGHNTNDMTPIKMAKYEHCDYCGVVFVDNADLQRHLRKDPKCDAEEEVGEELTVKHLKRNIGSLENEGLQRLYRRVITLNKDYLREKKAHYIKKEYSADTVQKKIDKIVWHLFKESYMCFLTCLYFMSHGPTAQALMGSIANESQLETVLPRKLNNMKRDWFQDIKDNEGDGYSSSSDSSSDAEEMSDTAEAIE
jgi:hypothetical protein